MRKFISIIVALAIAGLFMPAAYAEESATLGLQVTFDISHPPIWKVEPQDAKVIQGKTVRVELLAVDPDNPYGGAISYGCRWWLNGVRQEPMALPEGAVFTWKIPLSVTDPIILPPPSELPNLTWRVPYSINPQDVHEFEFFAVKTYVDTNANGIMDPGEEGLWISKKIRITVEQAVISIELTPSTWSLSKVKLGEIRTNVGITGEPIHSIRNGGNVSIVGDMGYGPMALNLIHPGLVQGVDTFITKVGESVLPPNDKLMLTPELAPGEARPLPLAFGAPMKITGPSVRDLGVTYEIRAYSSPHTGTGVEA